MSTNANDGGPAFPSPPITTATDGREWQRDGMALRDWMAGQALAGLCANPAVHAPNGMSGWSLVNCTTDDLVGYAYNLADKAMVARSASAPDSTKEGKPTDTEMLDYLESLPCAFTLHKETTKADSVPPLRQVLRAAMSTKEEQTP